jgi:glucosamine--fructose-6-phosphate aminotransferase (isomerizing)
MCGIVGYVGARPCEELLLSGLEKLEYRGYDSAGLSVLADGEVESVHAVGNLGNLRAAVEARANNGAGPLPPAETGIAHTRWATHGRVTEENAHPHDDSSGRVHIVLNGIVENHTELRRRLQEAGETFTSETDAEVVAHLIASHYDGDLAAAVRASYAELRGHYAFVAMHADEPQRLLGARKECPLVAGVGEGETFLASAIPAFLADTRIAMPIENGEIVEVEAGSIRVTDPEGNPVDRDAEEVTWDADAAEKGGYETFMLKEIHEQADAVAETVTDRLPGAEGVDLSDVDLSDEFLRGVRRIVIVACGTSYHAGLIGRYAIEEWARVPVEMDVASEYRYRNPVVGEGDLVIGITQSGETADTLAAMRLAREAGATVLAVTNIMGSQATRDSDAVLYTRAGLEIGVAATKTFVAQVAAMYLLGLRLAELRGTLPSERLAELVAEMKGLPSKMEETLAATAEAVRGAGILPLPRPPHRPAGLSRGGVEAEGDQLHPDRRLRRRRDEARPDRAARRIDAGDLHRHRQPGAGEGPLQRRGGACPRCPDDRDRHRWRRAGHRGRRRDDRGCSYRLDPAADRGDSAAAAVGL